ncbi:MAG: nucleotidyltransferase family protein [Candidatus Marsarchaeota archaeon]|nr:nucleotidyltransferase family protein [Candidatus Marsarchaeota archaeon]MCL5412894.1 nucleotidyltransferase family protein [Candidatus Marsarchaeota archaeon]
MKAVILAGGYGKRLRPLTDTIPKPLVRVGGKPILEWQMLWLSRKCGIQSFVLLVGYLKDKVMSYVDSRKADLGIDVEYSTEKTQLGTGGALRNAKGLLDGEDSFVMFNGDNITNIDVTNMDMDNSVASIALVPLRSTYGIARLDGGKITEFDEKPIIPDYWMNSGVYTMSKDIFSHLPESGNMENTTFVELSKNRSLKGIKFGNAYFKGVDSIKDMEEASADLEKHRIFRDIA